MAKLLWIGHNWNNLSKMSSKAYTVRRSGKNVVVRWGPVESVGSRGGTLCWYGRTQSKVHNFRSEKRAAEFVKECIEKKLAKGYERLPGAVRIH